MIPFIYVFADGACGKNMEDRPPDIDLLGSTFVARGGRYVITLFADDVAQLQAVMHDARGEPYTLVTQTVPNGPLVLGAIDRLVRESMRRLDEVH